MSAPTLPADLPLVVVDDGLGTFGPLVDLRPAFALRSGVGTLLESIEAALTKPGAPATGPMTQSPVVFFARAPAKVWMTAPASKVGTRPRDLERIQPRMLSLGSASTASSAASDPSG